MGLGQFALSGILGALAQPGLEPGEGPRLPTLQLPDRHAELPGDGIDRLTPQQAQHHLVLASQAPALAGRERTSPSCLPCDGQHGRAALALPAHKPCRIDHRLSITFHAVVLQFLGTVRCPEKPRAAQPFVFLRWITAGLRSRSQALLVAATRPGKDANVSNWSRARRILFWMSRARSQMVGAARISSRARSSVRRLALMVDVARLPIPFAKAKAEPSHSLRRKATGSSPAQRRRPRRARDGPGRSAADPRDPAGRNSGPTATPPACDRP